MMSAISAVEYNATAEINKSEIPANLRSNFDVINKQVKGLNIDIFKEKISKNNLKIFINNFQKEYNNIQLNACASGLLENINDVLIGGLTLIGWVVLFYIILYLITMLMPIMLFIYENFIDIIIVVSGIFIGISILLILSYGILIFLIVSIFLIIIRDIFEGPSLLYQISNTSFYSKSIY